jgi:hypothetical protein
MGEEGVYVTSRTLVMTGGGVEQKWLGFSPRARHLTTPPSIPSEPREETELPIHDLGS